MSTRITHTARDLQCLPALSHNIHFTTCIDVCSSVSIAAKNNKKVSSDAGLLYDISTLFVVFRVDTVIPKFVAFATALPGAACFGGFDIPLHLCSTLLAL